MGVLCHLYFIRADQPRNGSDILIIVGFGIDLCNVIYIHIPFLASITNVFIFAYIQFILFENVSETFSFYNRNNTFGRSPRSSPIRPAGSSPICSPNRIFPYGRSERYYIWIDKFLTLQRFNPSSVLYIFHLY